MRRNVAIGFARRGIAKEFIAHHMFAIETSRGRDVWHRRVDRLVMLGINAGGIARDSILRAPPARFVTIERQLFSFVHSRDMNRLRWLFVILHNKFPFVIL